MNPSFYITTAIDYVNSKPHLGTAYEKIGADVLARYYRLRGYETYFQMGLDEHSANVEKEAKKEGIEPKVFCDRMALAFEEVWKKLHISYDHFIRTTDPRHERTVQEMFQRIYDKGDIYEGHYEGWYCTSCERFFQEKDLVDGKCPVHQLEPEWITEQNYFFALSRYQERLISYLQEYPEFIQPKIRYNEIMNVLESGLEDISVSRAGMSWGIPLPFNKNQTIYVWFDALINYISGIDVWTEEKKFSTYWPCDVHVIGKDITRFHCIIWPAMLMACDLPLPKQVFGHGFIYLKGAKMSKTTGTLVSPLEAADAFGPEALRYFLMREVPFDKDGDFNWESFAARYTADLANNLGNLLSRVMTMLDKYRGSIIPSADTIFNHAESVQKNALKTCSKYHQTMQLLKFSNAFETVWKFLDKLNTYIEQQMPWKLAKDPDKQKELDTVLYTLVEGLRIVTYLVSPVMPSIAQNILSQLGIATTPEEMSFSDVETWGGLKAGTTIGEKTVLFPKKELELEKE